MYEVSLSKFTGPLDLLVSLIEEKKMAIGEISLAQVTDQFLEYVKNLHGDLLDLLKEKREITGDIEKKMKEVIDKFLISNS